MIDKPPLTDSLFSDGHSSVQSRTWVLWFQKIYDHYNSTMKYLDPTYPYYGKAAPVSPFEGLMAYADGVSWNPGGGKGIYQYYSGTWNKI